jgi:hypothetical protein
VTNFRADYDAASVSGGEVTDFRDYVRRVTGDGITGNCLEIVVPAAGPYAIVDNMSRSNPCVVTTRTAHGFQTGDRVVLRSLPPPFNVLSPSYGAWGYVATVLSPVTFSIASGNPNTFGQPINTSGLSAAYNPADPGRTVKKRISMGGWHRPFGPLRAGGNGLPVDDSAAGGSLPRRDWDPSNKYNFSPGSGYETAYYGYPGYHSTYKTPTDWHGSEFWLQFRVKMPGRRFWDKDQPPGKMAMIDQTTRGGFIGELIPSSQSHYRPAESEKGVWYTDRSYWPSKVTHPVMYGWYTGGSNSRSLLDHPRFSAGMRTRLQPGQEPYLTTCLSTPNGESLSDSACVWFPHDEWLTFLVHWKGGRDNRQQVQSFNYWDTDIEVFVQLQGHDDYVKLYDCRDDGSNTKGFPWSFTSDGNPAVVPGLNCLRFNGYMNEVPASSGWTQRICQVIFSKSFIPCPKS